MKKYLIIFTLILSPSVYASKVKKGTKKVTKNVENKEVVNVFSVPKLKPEILIGSKTPPLIESVNKRRPHFYYAGINRGSLTYKLPAINGGGYQFSPELLGLSIGQKNVNELYHIPGYWELVGDWQRFSRKSGIYFQKLNVYQLSIFQNVDLYCSKNQTFFFSAGLGISPLFLTAEQSVFGNSETLLGGMGLLKFDFIFPFKNQYEWDLTLKSGWGNVGGHKIFISNIGLGINFE